MWGCISSDFIIQSNFNIGFSSMKSENLIQLSQWQYWWWFWFCFLWSLYFFFINRTIRTRTLKMKPKIYTSFRSHGKWGDFLACIVPSIWCFNILVNSNFILKLTEWQSESTIFTIRIRGRQWYWVYKFELRHIVDLMSVPKNVGRNKWIVQTGSSIEVADDYYYALKIRAYNEKIVDKWNEIQDSVNRFVKTNDPIYLGNLFFQKYEKNFWLKKLFKFKFKKDNFKNFKLDFSKNYSDYKKTFLNFNVKKIYLKRRLNNLDLVYVSRKFFLRKNLNYISSYKKSFNLNFFKNYFKDQNIINLRDIRSSYADLKLDNKITHIYKDRSMSIDTSEKKNEMYNNSRQFKKVVFQKMPILVTKNYIYTIHTKNIKNAFFSSIDKNFFFDINENQKNRIFYLINYIKRYELLKKRDLYLDLWNCFKPKKNINLIYTIKKKNFKKINNMSNLFNKNYKKYIKRYNYKINLKINYIVKPKISMIYSMYFKNFSIIKKNEFKDILSNTSSYNMLNIKNSVINRLLLKNPDLKLFDLSKFFFLNKNKYFRKLFLNKKNIKHWPYKVKFLIFSEKLHQKRKILNNYFYYSKIKNNYYNIKKFNLKIFLKKLFNIKDYFNIRNQKKVYFKNYRFRLNKINNLYIKKRFNKQFSYIFQNYNKNSFFEKRIANRPLKYYIYGDDIFNYQKDHENRVKNTCMDALLDHAKRINKGGLSVNFHTTKTIDQKINGEITFLTLRQKRYKRKKVIFSRENIFFNFEKNLNEKEYDIKNKPFLGEILKSLDFTPDSNYRSIKKNRFRNEIFSSQLSRRLLRTKKTLVLPAHANIGLISNSYDVIHSWFIPSLGIKIDCVPGRATHHTFYCDSVGFYYGQCAEICGRFHHHMPIKLCVLPFEHFCIWWNHFGLPKLLGIVHTNKFQSDYGNNKFIW